jgi:hypothetical protein
LFVQWGLFLGAIAIFYRIASVNVQKKLLLIISLLFFAGSYFWRFHIERGQIYVLYLFLLACAYGLAKSSSKFKYNQVFSGFLVGLTASLRPTVVLMFIPSFIYKQWKLLIGNIIGLFSGIFISFVFAGASLWNSYFTAVKGYADGNTILNEDKSEIIYPEQIEGMTNVSSYIDFPSRDTSFINFFQIKLGLNVDPNIFLFLLGIALLFVAFFLYQNRSRKNTINVVFLSGILIYLISEYFIPTPRSTYNNIQWIMPVAILIMSYNPINFLTNRLNILLLISLFFSIGFTWMSMGIRTSDTLMILYTVLMFVGLVMKDNPATKYETELEKEKIF